MKKLLFYLFILCSTSIVAQNGITFEVEQLSKPEKLYPVASPDEIYRYLMLFDNESTIRITEKDIWKPPFNVIAKSESPDSLLYFGYNSFFCGMYQAYADHRPFVLSPDMIWLLINQGFAQHVNANHESLRKYFVNFSGKESLIVQSHKKLKDPSLLWEEIFPQFTEQIRKEVGGHLVETLTCNFSTTTSLEKTVSEITIMETVKSYFEFITIMIVCGIPEITLEGTPQDWEKVLNKARGLKEYKLEWWISQLEPLLEEFVKASKGEVNKDAYETISLILEKVNVKPEDRKVVLPAREYSAKLKSQSDTQEICPVVAMQVPDSTIITGKSSDLMCASAAAVLNAIKYMANIPDDMYLISPVILNPIIKLKTETLGGKNVSLSLEEVLSALAICAVTNPTAEHAMEKLEELKNLQAHSTTIISKDDEQTFRKLGMHVTCDPEYPSQNLYYN